MKNIFALIIAVIAFSATAQVTFNTGNTQLDADLNVINKNGTADYSAFKTDLSVSFGVSEKKLDYMKVELKMAPGEIYFALEIAKVAKTSIDEVLNIYKTDKSKGWGNIAKAAGIKPGSPEFHVLKNNASSKKSKGNSGNKGNGNGNSNGNSKGKK